MVMKRRSAELVRMWKCLITGPVRANIGSRQPREPGAGRSALTRRLSRNDQVGGITLVKPWGNYPGERVGELPW